MPDPMALRSHIHIRIHIVSLLFKLEHEPNSEVTRRNIRNFGSLLSLVAIHLAPVFAGSWFPSHDWRWQLAAAGVDQMELQPGTQSRSLQQLGEITTTGRANCGVTMPAQVQVFWGVEAVGLAPGTGERTRLRASAVAFWRRKPTRDAAGEVPHRLKFAASVSVQMKATCGFRKTGVFRPAPSNAKPLSAESTFQP